MTGRSDRQPDQHGKGRHCRRQQCSPDAEQGLGDWALRYRSSKCDADRWLLVAASWDCNWRRLNNPWGSIYVLDHVSWQNTVARLLMEESVQPGETSSGSSENWSGHLTAWKHPSRGWYIPTRHSFHSTSSMASTYQQLCSRLPSASTRVPFSGHWLRPSLSCLLSRVRKPHWKGENDARRAPCRSMLHHREI